MKKNMLTILVIVLSIVNLTLTAYMIITVIPNAQRTDQLITKIMQIIDLELESPLPSNINTNYSIENVEKYTLEEMTANLKTGEDGKAHYAVINASLTINNADEDYAKLNPMVDTMKSDLSSIVIENVQKYTFDELSEPETKKEIRKQIVADVQTLFNSRFIVDCTVDYLIQ